MNGLSWLARSWALALIIAAAASAFARPGGHGSITANMDCSSCHSESGWSVEARRAGETSFDHSRTGFPLTGQHRAATCTDCHRSDRVISRQCSACHQDAHQRQLGQGCDRCHSAASWSSVSAIRLHRSTRLPLSGMHALAACSECHVRASENQWRGTPADCFACHAGDYRRSDIHPLHRGVPGDASKPALPKNCGACHQSTAWTPAFAPQAFAFRAGAQALTSFSHDAVFPISFGKHRRAACADCHLRAEMPRLVNCTGCHEHDVARLLSQHHSVTPAVSGCVFCHPGGARR